MKSYLLDTNVITHWVNKARGHELIEEQLFTLPIASLHISAVTVWEVCRMAERAKVSTKASRALMEAIGLFAVEPLTAQIAALSGNLHGWLSNKGQTIGERDSMFAGTALACGHIMVTDNMREFERVPGIEIQNWRTRAA